MDKSYIIYKHIFPNGKLYIGLTGCTPEKRWRGGTGYKKQSKIRNAINEFGWDNVKHEIVYMGLTKSEAKQKEIELIAFYKTQSDEYGYNLTRGGGGANGRILTESQKKEIGERFSKANKGKKLSASHKAKIKAGMKWGKPPHITSEMIIASNKTRVYTKETRNKISENTKLGMQNSKKWKELQLKREAKRLENAKHE